MFVNENQQEVIRITSPVLEEKIDFIKYININSSHPKQTNKHLLFILSLQ